ncbi:MAG: S1C family serine protease [Alphaproteobacteria bacterium]|nr:S1C family serine protease [Alphaproteobacteria bacterium]MBU1278131.1 S1C family serine protease [Alphaproteobacteria bacterium]MBU1573990.1 S1C family serine protease [Alphaproteobacteria bacterium]MBU1826967.1 S1C family serine protease [Alphaproteobacteria bacterium]MBU2077214.1 S1C family serine protease [Alphaproteobacteria bacterium]
MCSILPPVGAGKTLQSGKSAHPLYISRYGPARQRVQRSLGSGVIVSKEGLVVSTYHMVAKASDIRVVLNDRRDYEDTVVFAKGT